MQAMLFEVHGLSKRFGRIAALSDVSFHVRAGEVLGLIGPNGAGKSTLFECLAGVLPSDSGDGARGGQPVGSARATALLFYVPDGIAPWPDAVGALGARFHASDSCAGRADLRDEVVEQLDLRPAAATRRSARCPKASASARCSRSAC